MNTINIGVPVERYRQLQRLADIDQLSIADTIGDFINQAIQEKRIPDELPGWIVQRVGDHVRFAIEEADIDRSLAPAQAVSMAEMLERLSVPGAQAKAYLDVDAMLKFERRGTAVKIVDAETKAFRAVARSVAQDVAHLLRKAAA